MGFVLPIIVAVIGVWIAFSIVVWATGRDTLLDISAAGAPLGLGDGESVDETAVASVKFDTGLRGYRTDQVDAALTRLAWEIGRRDELLAEMQARLDGTADTAELETAAEAGEEPHPSPEADDDAGSEAGRDGTGETAPRGDS